MLLRTLILTVVAVCSVAGQNTPQRPVAAQLVCPAPNQPSGRTRRYLRGQGRANAELPAASWARGGQQPRWRFFADYGPSGAVCRTSPGAESICHAVVLRSGREPGGTAVVLSGPDRATAGRRCFKDVPGTALAGVSLGSFAVAPEACQAQCKQNTGCQGYTYYPAGPGNPTAMCDLKSQITEPQPNECCLSGLKMITPAPAPAPALASASAPASAAASVRASPGASAPASTPASARASTPGSTPAIKPITGNWVNQFGAISRIVQQGNAISGTYSDAKQPSLSGTFQGTFDGKTLRATLKWKSGADSSKGSLLLNLTPQGSLEGTWTDAAGVSGPWSMGPAR